LRNLHVRCGRRQSELGMNNPCDDPARSGTERGNRGQHHRHRERRKAVVIERLIEGWSNRQAHCCASDGSNGAALSTWTSTEFELLRRRVTRTASGAPRIIIAGTARSAETKLEITNTAKAIGEPKKSPAAVVETAGTKICTVHKLATVTLRGFSGSGALTADPSP